MELLTLFINFMNDILSFEIFNIPIYIYLITLTIVSIVFQIIKNMADK